MIRSEPGCEIGLIERPDPRAICFDWRPFSVEITCSASGDPASYSMPAYRSSVFSRTITTSTLSYRLRTRGYVLQGRRHAYSPSSWRSATLTERKPVPIGVVIGPLSATPFCFTDASVSSGSGVPCSSMTSTPAWRTSHSRSTPVASMTRRVASVSSGPVPSPGMRVTRWAIGGATLATGRYRSRRMATKKSVELSGVVVAQSAISSIDPDAGILMYRGYDIAELAEHSTYEEVCWLLLHGELPGPGPFAAFETQLANDRSLPPEAVE